MTRLPPQQWQLGQDGELTVRPQDELEKRLEDAERELSSLSADLAAAHKRLRRDGGSSTAEEQLAAARKCEEAALAQARHASEIPMIVPSFLHSAKPLSCSRAAPVERSDSHSSPGSIDQMGVQARRAKSHKVSVPCRYGSCRQR